MPVLEGAMIGGTLIPEKEFKMVLKEEILNNEEYLTELRRLIRISINNIRSNDMKNLYKNIEKIETELLKNPATSLMVINNISIDGAKKNFYLHEDEKVFIKKSGSIRGAKLLKEKVLQEELSDILSNHLTNFIKEVETYKFTKKEIKEFFNDDIFLNYTTKREMGSRARDSDYNLKYIIYGNNPQYLGQIADAFLNHIGNMHKNLLLTKGKKLSQLQELPYSIREEEGVNFFHLLVNSTNSTGWWTGGDLILLGENNQVVANIQLKTKQGSSLGKMGKITSATLYDDLLELQNMFEQETLVNIDFFADKFYKTFKTSGITEKTEEELYKYVNQKAMEVARQALGNKNLTS